VSVPGGSHSDARERLRSHPNMKGGITNMAKKAKGGKKKAGKKR
jgi:altronate dehydratase